MAEGFKSGGRIQEWVERLPSCLESDDPGTRERHLQLLATEGWCAVCGRCKENYKVTIQAGNQLKCWSGDDDVVIALVHCGRLIVFAKPLRDADKLAVRK